jgi:Glycosyltransferase family 87
MPGRRLAVARAGRVGFVVSAVLLIGAWIGHGWLVYSTSGLFVELGEDFGYFFALVHAVWTPGPNGLYDRASLDAFHNALAVYARQPVPGGQTPYPPIFAWLISPFMLVAPPLGFLGWTILNLVASCLLGWRVAALFAPASRSWVWLLVVASLPAGLSLMLGQPMGLLGWAFAEFYISARADRQLRAGLWLGCLLFKPQYLFLLLPLLAWKRQWVTLAGVSLGALVMVVGSILVAGVPATLDYPGSILAEGASFNGLSTSETPYNMINWRALVLHVPSLADDPQGLALTVLLSLMTILGAAMALRGPWVPSAPLFPVRIVVVIVATLLASYHSHLPGMLLLAMPAGAVLATVPLPRGTGLLVAAAVLATSLRYILVGTGISIAGTLMLLGILIAALVLIQSWRGYWTRPTVSRSTSRDSGTAPAEVYAHEEAPQQATL